MASPTKITWNRRNARDAKKIKARNKRTRKAPKTGKQSLGRAATDTSAGERSLADVSVSFFLASCEYLPILAHCCGQSCDGGSSFQYYFHEFCESCTC